MRAVIGASDSQTGVLASSFTPFQAGSWSIAAPDIQFTNQALVAVNNWESGNSGNLRLTARRLTMQDSALFVSTISGKGANIEISTPRLKLDQDVIVSATAQGQGGNMTLTVPELLLLRNGSRIATRGFNNVDSGNVDINAGLIAKEGFVKRRMLNQHLLERFICNLDLEPSQIKSHPNYSSLCSYGIIAA